MHYHFEAILRTDLVKLASTTQEERENKVHSVIKGLHEENEMVHLNSSAIYDNEVVVEETLEMLEQVSKSEPTKQAAIRPYNRRMGMSAAKPTIASKGTANNPGLQSSSNGSEFLEAAIAIGSRSFRRGVPQSNDTPKIANEKTASSMLISIETNAAKKKKSIVSNSSVNDHPKKSVNGIKNTHYHDALPINKIESPSRVTKKSLAHGQIDSHRISSRMT
jgi:hypothetical protein